MAVGIPVGRLFGLSWFVGGVYAALAGIFLGAREPSVDANIGLIALRAFPALIVGGLESPVGAVLAGILLLSSGGSRRPAGGGARRATATGPINDGDSSKIEALYDEAKILDSTELENIRSYSDDGTLIFDEVTRSRYHTFH